MNYTWIKPGTKCRWNDPALEDYEPGERKDTLLREFTVVSVNGNRAPAEGDDDMVLISDGHTEAEVPPRQPPTNEFVGMSRAHAPGDKCPG